MGMSKHDKDALDHWLTTEPCIEGDDEAIPDPDDDHMLAKTIRALATEPKPWPYNRLRVRAIDDAGQIRIEIDNPPTDEGRAILMDVLPQALEMFLAKNKDYQNFSLPDLGPRAHFVGIWRKVGKLKRGLWDGEALAGEQVSELLQDLLGHILLALLEVQGRIKP